MTKRLLKLERFDGESDRDYRKRMARNKRVRERRAKARAAKRQGKKTKKVKTAKRAHSPFDKVTFVEPRKSVLTAIIAAEEIRLYVDGKGVFTSPGSSSMYLDDICRLAEALGHTVAAVHDLRVPA